MFRFAVLLLPVVAVAGAIIALFRHRSPWVAARGWWLVWPLLAVELVVLDAVPVAAVVLVVGAALYALDATGRLPSLYR